MRRQESGRARRDEGREKMDELQGPHRPHKTSDLPQNVHTLY